MSAPGSATRTHYKSIDALRGVAALAVLVYHLWLRYFHGLSTQSHAFKIPRERAAAFLLTLPIQYGYFGVTLFFVISGFCIHLPQARRFRASGADGLRPLPFAKQRVRRLYPAYLASIVFTSVAVGIFPAALAVLNGKAPHVVTAFGLKDALASMAFLLPFGLASESFNGVYWTLIFEVQFYAVYPVLLYAGRRLGFVKILAALMAAEIICSAGLVPVSGYLFVGRWFEWYLGMYAAEAVASGKVLPARPLTVLGLCAGVTATFHPVLWPFRDLLLSVGFVGLLLLCIEKETAVAGAAIARSKSLLAVGVFSYSLYLIHVPVIDVVWTACRLAAKHQVISATTAGLLAPACIPLALLLGSAFYALFERPFMRAKTLPIVAERPRETPVLARAA